MTQFASVTRADNRQVRQLLADQTNPRIIEDDDDLAELWEGIGNIALLGADGEFVHAHWSEVNRDTTIVYLLPEGMNLGKLAPILLEVLNEIIRKFPQALRESAVGTFRQGFDPITGEEDFGQSKADAWADFTKGLGHNRPIVTPIFNSNGERSATAARLPMALAISSLRVAIGGN